MKNTKKFVVNAICAGGLLALVLTGCTKKNTAQDEILNTEVSEVADDVLGNIPEEEKEVAEELDMNTESFLSSGKNVENQDLIDAAVMDFKNYFGITIDAIQYDVDVFYREKYDYLEARNDLIFGLPGNNEILADDRNIGSDGFPTKEARERLKPEYSASYSDDKKLRGLSVSYTNWDETSVPITVGECKEVAEEFLKSNHMVTGGKMEFITAKVISDWRIYLYYKNGTEGAIGMSVNTYASKVENFEYMNQKEMEINTKPVKEGEGVG